MLSSRHATGVLQVFSENCLEEKKKKKMPAQLNRRLKDAIRNKKASFKNLKWYPKKKEIESGIPVG